jgi:septal ring factor EnvC (AmiA/AmiB activator)
MKAILPWVVAVLAVGAAALLLKSNPSKSADVQKLQAQAQEVETLRAEVTELKSQQVPVAEITQLRKDREDLLRLRNEVTKLRNESQQLTKQAQTAQAALAGAQAETQRAQQQAQAAAAAQVQAQAQAQATVQSQQQVQLFNACFNNLRQIDAAKQQWALENRKTAEAIPTVQDVTAYFRDQAVPACPAAGKYTLNAVGVAPTCTIPGHTLASQ